MNRALQIIKAHAGCSVQDLGRTNLAHLGITQGGAADEYAFNWANKLLNNQFNAPAVEITLGGFEAECLRSGFVAITGAKDNVSINGKPVASWHSYRVNAGDTIKVVPSREGLRNYLAFSGGFDIPKTQGSCATVPKDKLGGLKRDGTPLKAGDQLAALPPSCANREASINPNFVPHYSQEIALRVLLGSQAHHFSKTEQNKLFNNSYAISPAASKMGYQLMGEEITPPQEQLISEPIALGAIQIPPAGNPIVMLCERQTIGGYHKLGQVARLDVAKLAQARPGQSVQFIAADPLACSREYVSWLKFFQQAHP